VSILFRTTTKREAERVGKYMIKPLLSLKWLSIDPHLKLTFMAERPPPPQIVQQELLMAAEEREKYF